MSGQDTLQPTWSPGDTPADHSGARTFVSDSALKNITGELVARLANRIPAATRTAERLGDQPHDAEIEAFCDALIAADPSRSQHFFETLIGQGKTTEVLCLGYFHRAACRLGERWIEDHASFLEVTLGCARLHGLLREMGNAFVPATPSTQPDMRALFASAPGDTHVFGVTLAASFFRRAGWTVDTRIDADVLSLSHQAISGRYAFVGLSIGCEATLPALKDLIATIRRAEAPPPILIDGPLCELQPHLAQQLEVEKVPSDVTNAPFLLQSRLISSMNR